MLGGQVSLWKYDVGTLSETKIRDGIKDKGLDSFFSKYTKPRGHWQGKNRILEHQLQVLTPEIIKQAKLEKLQ